jgi:hypothetical protein
MASGVDAYHQRAERWRSRNWWRDMERVVGAAPVIGFGHRMVNCTRHSEPRRVWPVHVVAHEFAAGQPERELWLSPDRAVSPGT